MPEAKVGGLHPPHHPAYVTSPLTPSAVTECPAPVSYSIFQSQAVASHRVSQPLPWLSHTNSPPATQWSRFWGSDSNGAMNRGFGSHGLGTDSALKQDGEMVIHDLVVPSERPPFVVRAMFSAVYSCTERSALLGSTMPSPPSPPKGDTMVGEPLCRYDTPLSWSPPHRAVPPPVTLPV